MATMIAEVYDALLEAGASKEKARSAAEAVAEFDGRFGRLEQSSTERAADSKSQISDLRVELKAEIADVRTDISALKAELVVIKWMGGVIVAGVAALIVRAFFG